MIDYRNWLRATRTVLIAALLLVPLPAQAHSEAELEAWLEQWEATAEMDWPLALADLPLFDLDAHQTAALEDMVDRHPCSRVLETWVEACEPPVPVPRSVAPSKQSAPTVSVDRGMGSNVEQWRGLVAAYFGGEVERALCVVAWESGGNPNASSPSNDHGLFQIHAPLWTDHYGVSIAQLYDPELNTRIAKSIRDAMGWGAWSAVKRGKC